MPGSHEIYNYRKYNYFYKLFFTIGATVYPKIVSPCSPGSEEVRKIPHPSEKNCKLINPIIGFLREKGRP